MILAQLVKQQEEALIPKFWGWLWIFEILVRVGDMYSFLLFYSIRNHTFCYFLNWHDKSLFILFLLMLFWHFFFPSIFINSLFLTVALIALLWIWSNHFKWLSLIFFFLISNKFYWYEKGDTLVHRECTRGQQIK